jgi:hypothetical protein
MAKELQTTNLQERSMSILSSNESRTVLIDKQSHFEISCFGGEMSETNQLKEVANVKLAFPALPNGFYLILLDRVRELKISDERLKFAVGHVIDNCEYPSPTIAQFIGFDRKIKLYNQQQILKMNDDVQGIGKFYKLVRLIGQSKPLYAHESDIEKYKLELWSTCPKCKNLTAQFNHLQGKRNCACGEMW